jgi:hypothetical protein
MNKIVISLTTVPERLTQDVEDGFKLVMKSICEQNFNNYEVHLNLPLIYNVVSNSSSIDSNLLYEIISRVGYFSLIALSGVLIKEIIMKLIKRFKTN